MRHHCRKIQTTDMCEENKTPNVCKQRWILCLPTLLHKDSHQGTECSWVQAALPSGSDRPKSTPAKRRRTPSVPGAGWQAGPRSTVWAAGEVRPSGVPRGLWRGGGRVSKSKGPQWEGSWGEGQPEHSAILEHVVCLRGGRIWREVPVGLSLGEGLSPCSSCWSHPSPVQRAPQMTQKSCAPPSSSQ